MRFIPPILAEDARRIRKTTAMSESYSAPAVALSSWAAEERPREKALAGGLQPLTDAELIAILIGSGSREENAVALARRILASVGHDLNELSRLRVADLTKFKGMGPAKAIAIAAAAELGRRRQLTPLRERPRVLNSSDAYRIVGPLLQDLPREEFWVLCLNRAGRVLERVRISSGGVAAVMVDAKIVYERALSCHACVSLLLAHNHPSNNATPSRQDILLTHKLVRGGRLLDIHILDHLIITQTDFYSFADEGQLIPAE